MSSTNEIEREQWKSFFDSFSRRHEGWLVTVEVLSAEIGDQIEMKDVPLQGITAETDGTDSIEILVATRDGGHVSRTIDHPRHVYVKQTSDGTDEVLEIEGQDAATLVYFRSSLPPLSIDGV